MKNKLQQSWLAKQQNKQLAAINTRASAWQREALILEALDQFTLDEILEHLVNDGPFARVVRFTGDTRVAVSVIALYERALARQKKLDQLK